MKTNIKIGDRVTWTGSFGIGAREEKAHRFVGTVSDVYVTMSGVPTLEAWIDGCDKPLRVRVADARKA